MTCPYADKAIEYLDEQLPVSEAKAIEAHLQECSYCRKQFDDTEFLLDSIRANGPLEVDEDDFVSGVMTAIDRPVTRHNTMKYVLAAGFGILCLIPLLSLVLSESPENGGFTARGRDGRTMASLVDVVPLVVTDNRIRPINSDTVLGPEDGLTFQYTNYFDAPVFFMAFAIDSAREIHWFYPAYLSENQNPEAVELPTEQRGELMPEIVKAEAVTDGDLVLIVLMSEKKHGVKEIENRLEKKPIKELGELFSKKDIVRKWRIGYKR